MVNHKRFANVLQKHQMLSLHSTLLVGKIAIVPIMIITYNDNNDIVREAVYKESEPFWVPRGG